jgi:hypothetical protein
MSTSTAGGADHAANHKDPLFDNAARGIERYSSRAGKRNFRRLQPQLCMQRHDSVDNHHHRDQFPDAPRSF